jgi:hypothetical protein
LVTLLGPLEPQPIEEGVMGRMLWWITVKRGGTPASPYEKGSGRHKLKEMKARQEVYPGPRTRVVPIQPH